MRPSARVVSVALGMHREPLATEPAGDRGDLLADTAGVLDDREDRERRADHDREVVGLTSERVADEVLERTDEDRSGTGTERRRPSR